jgi:outer membrane protein OmpA-like peptidoglycan-associated protein
MADLQARHERKHGADDGGYVAVGCITGLVALGAILFASIVALWADDPVSNIPEAPPVAVAAAPVPETGPVPVVAPEGAGVVPTERDGLPLLTVYFDSGQAAVIDDFKGAMAEILAYLEANPEATVAISGFNDPSGNAELNAQLSKERAQNVQGALIALGVPEERTDLVKPDDTTRAELTAEEARRVEVTIVE